MPPGDHQSIRGNPLFPLHAPPPCLSTPPSTTYARQSKLRKVVRELPSFGPGSSTCFHAVPLPPYVIVRTEVYYTQLAFTVRCTCLVISELSSWLITIQDVILNTLLLPRNLRVYFLMRLTEVERRITRYRGGHYLVLSSHVSLIWRIF